MATDDPRTDGGATKEDIFGTGDRQRQRTPPAERLRRLFDGYVRAPFSIMWNDWRTRIGGLGVLFYLLMGTVGVVLIPPPQIGEGPTQLGAFEEITLAMVFGTDDLGRSILKLVVHATPAMLKMALAGVVFSVGVATLIGLVSGYKSGTVDTVLMTVTDIVLVLPGLPLIIVLLSVYPVQEPFLIGAVVAVDTWPGLARALRSQVLTLREEDFVEAARSMGLSTSTVIGQELMPKLAPYILINAAQAAAAVIGTSVALYFIGVLPIGNQLNWGVTMQFAYDQGNAISNPGSAGHWLFFPLLALSGMTFVLVLFGQGMDRVFNPRLRARHTDTVTEDEADDSGLL